jgi:hypothetical protein
MLSNEHERVHFQAFQQKTSIQLYRSNEDIDENIDNEYGFSSNDIIIEEKQNLNENETEEKTKEGKKKFLHQILQLISKLMPLISKRNQKKC